MKRKILIGEKEVEVEILGLSPDQVSIKINGPAETFAVKGLPTGEILLTDSHGRNQKVRAQALRGHLNGKDVRLEEIRATGKKGGASEGLGGGKVLAPMPGKILKLAVASGDNVKKGQALLHMEAMKMEHVLKAPRDGTVAKINCAPGQVVQGGVELIELGD